MERNEWIRHSENISRLLRQIREQGSPPFTPEEEKHFQESLSANELGIAFDFLCWKFENVGSPISQEIFDLIADAGSRMGCSPDDWQKLQILVR
jgi:hypothetical protein